MYCLLQKAVSLYIMSIFSFFPLSLIADWDASNRDTETTVYEYRLPLENFCPYEKGIFAWETTQSQDSSLGKMDLPRYARLLLKGGYLQFLSIDSVDTFIKQSKECTRSSPWVNVCWMKSSG